MKWYILRLMDKAPACAVALVAVLVLMKHFLPYEQTSQQCGIARALERRGFAIIAL